MKWIFLFDFGIKRPAKLKTDIGTPSCLDIPPIKSCWTLFKKVLKTSTKMVQLSMDRSNVNLKLFKVMKEQTKELSFPGLIDFGSCNLYDVMVPLNLELRQVDGS